MTILHADSISKARGTRRVLTAATLKVGAGTVVGLLGRMGEGKSTLLKICAGVEAPDSGWVLFAGRQSSRAHLPDTARRGLYYLADSWMTSGTTYPLGAPAQAWQHERFKRDYLGPKGASDLPPETLHTDRAHTGN